MDGDIAEKLTKLADLHEAGSLSDEEFAAAKAQLLGASEVDQTIPLDVGRSAVSTAEGSAEVVGASRARTRLGIAILGLAVIAATVVGGFALFGGDEETEGSASPSVIPTTDRAVREADEDACRGTNADVDGVRENLDFLKVQQEKPRALRVLDQERAIRGRSDSEWTDLARVADSVTSEWLDMAAIAGSSGLEDAFEDTARTYNSWVDAQFAGDAEASVTALDLHIGVYSLLLDFCAER